MSFRKETCTRRDALVVSVMMKSEEFLGQNLTLVAVLLTFITKFKPGVLFRRERLGVGPRYGKIMPRSFHIAVHIKFMLWGLANQTHV
jgi:hypothetical protein